MTPAVLLLVACSLAREVTSLGGSLVSVQTKLAGLEDPESTSWVHMCAGTVMSVHSALTCASCLVYPDDKLGPQTVSSDDLRVYGGDMCPDRADRDSSGVIVYVRYVQLHPEYLCNEMGTTPNEYNFALLVTKKPFTIGDHLKILPLYSTDVDEVRNVLAANGTKCFTMTWYFYMNGRPVNENPDWGEIPVALETIQACGNLSDSIARFPHSYSCAKGSKLPVCRVDTGSPVVCQGKLLAIIINDKLHCDNDEQHVVISGINNALAFLEDPDKYGMNNTQPTEGPLTTVVVRGRSSQNRIALEMAALIPPISATICSIKGILATP